MQQVCASPTLMSFDPDIYISSVLQSSYATVFTTLKTVVEVNILLTFFKTIQCPQNLLSYYSLRMILFKALMTTGCLYYVTLNKTPIVLNRGISYIIYILSYDQETELTLRKGNLERIRSRCLQFDTFKLLKDTSYY